VLYLGIWVLVSSLLLLAALCVRLPFQLVINRWAGLVLAMAMYIENFGRTRKRVRAHFSIGFVVVLWSFCLLVTMVIAACYYCNRVGRWIGGAENGSI
jgi:hypothetical protein